MSKLFAPLAADGARAQQLMRQGSRLIFAAERFGKEIGAGVDIEAFAYMIDVGVLTRGELAHAARVGDGSLDRDATFIAWREEIDETDAARFGVNSRSLPSIIAGLDRRMGIAVEAMGTRFDDWIRAETQAIKERYNATRDGEAPDWRRFTHLEATAVGDESDKWKIAIDGVSQNGRTPIALLHTLADGARVAHDLAATSGLFCTFEKPDLGVVLPSHPRLADNDAANDWIDAAVIRRDGERLFNCQPDNRQPDWKEFDRLEIDGCIDDPEHPGTTIGGLSDSEAQFWTIYARRPDGEPEPITDCATLVDAIRTGQDLANIAGLDCAHPRLGILDALDPPMAEDEARQWIEKQEAALKNDGPSF